jgi:exonuclease III
MNVHLISHNVQGLNKTIVPRTVRDYYLGKFSSLDILCIQEHKLRNPKFEALGQ